MITINPNKQISESLLEWFFIHGRRNLPWQLPRTPYRVWVSEIMLQQTQVQTVIPYFNRFMEAIPTLDDLAETPEDTVLALWSGLGYYSRARNLHHCAKIISKDYNGNFPSDLKLLMALPGIGQSTAAAIISQAFDKPEAILDANVKRVLSRFFAIEGHPDKAATKKTLWDLAYACMPETHCSDYTQAIMDLGALCCTNKKPDCHSCPIQDGCQAFKKSEQHLYPWKKINKSVPLHHQQFLVMHHENKIYLEKRPPVGLWGGLWCLPSIDSQESPVTYINSTYSLKADTPQPIISFKHKFSHFHLHIDALSISVRFFSDEVHESPGRWFLKDQLASLGLAKPTSIILSAMD